MSSAAISAMHSSQQYPPQLRIAQALEWGPADSGTGNTTTSVTFKRFVPGGEKPVVEVALGDAAPSHYLLSEPTIAEPILRFDKAMETIDPLEATPSTPASPGEIVLKASVWPDNCRLDPLHGPVVRLADAPESYRAALAAAEDVVRAARALPGGP